MPAEAAASSIMNPNSIAQIKRLNWPAMNARESIARVCAQDAILSPTFKVQEFMSIYDMFRFSIALSKSQGCYILHIRHILY